MITQLEVTSLSHKIEKNNVVLMGLHTFSLSKLARILRVHFVLAKFLYFSISYFLEKGGVFNL